MTIEDAARNWLGGIAWWDSEKLLQAAQAWFDANRAAAGNVKARQWEGLCLVGTTASTWIEYQARVQNWLRAAERRDERKKAWGQTGLVDGLLGALDGAVAIRDGSRAEAFENLLAAVERQTAQEELRDIIRLKQAQAFIATLGARVRISRRK
jgi:hypothetical protein